jgi:cytochrome c-type biogenesis protein CcmH
MRRAALLLAVCALLVVPVASASAAAPRASLTDIENEVMCVECGTSLNVSTSPVANQEREMIRRLIAQGKTKAQIKSELVATYGPNVLADPPDSGFGVAAWWIPVVLVPLALLLAVVLARRWRRRSRSERDDDAGGAESSAPRISEADSRRLDAELAAYDR